MVKKIFLLLLSFIILTIFSCNISFFDIFAGPDSLSLIFNYSNISINHSYYKNANIYNNSINLTDNLTRLESLNNNEWVNNINDSIYYKGKIYSAGVYSINHPPTLADNRPCYWKNQNLMKIDDSFTGNSENIEIYNGSPVVVFVHFYGPPDIRFRIFYKNKIYFFKSTFKINNMQIFNNKIYLVGYNDDTNKYPAYYVINDFDKLPHSESIQIDPIILDSNNIGILYDIFKINGEIYFSGVYEEGINSTACIWNLKTKKKKFISSPNSAGIKKTLIYKNDIINIGVYNNYLTVYYKNKIVNFSNSFPVVLSTMFIDAKLTSRGLYIFFKDSGNDYHIVFIKNLNDLNNYEEINIDSKSSEDLHIIGFIKN